MKKEIKTRYLLCIVMERQPDTKCELAEQYTKSGELFIKTRCHKGRSGCISLYREPGEPAPEGLDVSKEINIWIHAYQC